MQPSIMRLSANAGNTSFRFGAVNNDGAGRVGTMGSAIGAVGAGAHGQFGNRVMPMQFVRHGSAERGQPAIPRRQRSRDRSKDRNRTLSPAQAAVMSPARSNPAGQMEAQEWLEALQSVDERLRVLENLQQNIAQGIARNTGDIDNMKSELMIYRNKVAEDISKQLYNNPDSVKVRIEGIETQLLNEIP